MSSGKYLQMHSRSAHHRWSSTDTWCCSQFDSTPASIPVPSQYQNLMTGPPYTKVLLELHKCAPCHHNPRPAGIARRVGTAFMLLAHVSRRLHMLMLNSYRMTLQVDSRQSALGIPTSTRSDHNHATLGC